MLKCSLDVKINTIKNRSIKKLNNKYSWIKATLHELQCLMSSKQIFANWERVGVVNL